MNTPKPGASGVARTTEFNWKLILAGVAAALAIIFILQNTERGTVEFLFFDWTVGTWVALLITFVLGLVVGLLLPRFLGRRDKD